MAKKPTSNKDAETKLTAQTASKETAAEKFRKASLTNPRFVELKTSGKSVGIVGARPPTKVADPNINEDFQKENSNEDLAMSEDGVVERCPICNRTKCKRHLLACCREHSSVS